MNETVVPDSEHRGLVARLPQLPRDLAQLARFDRPIGWWLLFWPCVWGVWLTGAGWQLGLLAWLLLGAIAMRGAGCVYNDIVDAELDRKVARTASRPVASGRISKKLAWAWLLALCASGLLVLLQLRPLAQGVALGSLALVAAYPFMKGVDWTDSLYAKPPPGKSAQEVLKAVDKMIVMGAEMDWAALKEAAARASAAPDGSAPNQSSSKTTDALKRAPSARASSE